MQITPCLPSNIQMIISRGLWTWWDLLFGCFIRTAQLRECVHMSVCIIGACGTIIAWLKSAAFGEKQVTREPCLLFDVCDWFLLRLTHEWWIQDFHTYKPAGKSRNGVKKKYLWLDKIVFLIFCFEFKIPEDLFFADCFLNFLFLITELEKWKIGTYMAIFKMFLFVQPY